MLIFWRLDISGVGGWGGVITVITFCSTSTPYIVRVL